MSLVKASSNIMDWSKGEDQIIPFGKYAGSTLDWISIYHPQYFIWLHDQGLIINCPDSVMDAIDDYLWEEEDLFGDPNIGWG
jgi:hypothetical protein